MGAFGWRLFSWRDYASAVQSIHATQDQLPSAIAGIKRAFVGETLNEYESEDQ